MKAYQLTKVLLILTPIIILILGCTPTFNTYRTPPRISMQVFIRPLSNNYNKLCALMLPPKLPNKNLTVEEAKRWQMAYGQIIQQCLLQTRAFYVVELQNPDENINDAIKEAKRWHLNCVIIPTITEILPPTDTSSGILAINFKVISVKKRLVLWSIYAQAILTPQPYQDFIFWHQPFKPATNITQALSILTRDIALTIKNN